MKKINVTIQSSIAYHSSLVSSSTRHILSIDAVSTSSCFMHSQTRSVNTLAIYGLFSLHIVKIFSAVFCKFSEPEFLQMPITVLIKRVDISFLQTSLQTCYQNFELEIIAKTAQRTSSLTRIGNFLFKVSSKAQKIPLFNNCRMLVVLEQKFPIIYARL